jgi:transposase-like protein
MTSATFCLYCESAPLLVLSESDERITFFRCPQCHRQFAQSPGKSLTERWSGALSLVLYGVIFSPRPQAEAERIAEMLCAQKSQETIAWIESEIRLELASPKQNVRDILDNVASEQDLREFLALVANKLHQALQKLP